MIKKALCIGNAAYPEEKLKNPVNDAQDVASQLEALGFHCITLTDSTSIKMEESLSQFSDSLEETEVGLFFFAGHGMQIDGLNYLTAIDTNFEKELDAKFSSLALGKVIDTLERGDNSTSIIVLDACRSNPYERRWRGVNSSGLAPVYAPKGTMIAYATSPGQIAFDGLGANGAFTAAFLKHLATQNVPIEDLFKRVRNTLSATTSGKQISWEHTCLMGDFFFNQAILTDEFIAEYSKHALRDAEYHPYPDREVDQIIVSLRSHYWYTQNPAVSKLATFDFRATEKDELFVLGRNLYQAACGDATNAVHYFSQLHTRLSKLPDEVAFHMLNGILFEIYFDSHSRFRLKKKTGLMDSVFALEESQEFARSFDYIRQALLPYEKHLFYMPGNQKEILVDIINSKEIAGKSTVESISTDGQDVFYCLDRQTLVSNAETTFQSATSVSRFESDLASAMTTPRRRLKLTYTHTPSPDSSLVVPVDYKIQKISI